ncbi:hypothetical protein V2G26_008219 [Clonostachys chloroleuca]|uniref:Uncharacterized protein n=1 Tax=Clonostachys chloroleuca TaxID=1926264 RepID=A0AA35VCT2_9HYPO|nr:unnamed protein product [Clonostachys chloroleuca]
MPGPADFSVSIPIASPPQDLSSYARFMHDHTKRQMEAQGAFSVRKPGEGKSSVSSGASSMANGSSPTGMHI